MNEEGYLNDFNMISIAGMSQSKSLMAIKEAREGNYGKAAEYLNEANELMNEAHGLQFQMLQQESSGKSVEVTIVTVHAQDHMTTALMMHSMASEVIALYKRIDQV